MVIPVNNEIYLGADFISRQHNNPYVLMVLHQNG
jgi:hypothetical protein